MGRACRWATALPCVAIVACFLSLAASADEIEAQMKGSLFAASAGPYASMQASVDQIDSRTGDIDFFQDAISIPGNGGFTLNLGWKLTRVEIRRARRICAQKETRY